MALASKNANHYIKTDDSFEASDIIYVIICFAMLIGFIVYESKKETKNKNGETEQGKNERTK